MEGRIAELQRRSAAPRFWDNPDQAQATMQQLSSLQSRVSAWRDLASQVDELAELSAMARESLDQALPGILVRAIGRGLVKYFASEVAEEEIGEVAGILVNILGIALEQADTRSWRSLPYQIQVASFTIPPGAYEGRLRVYGGDGEEQIEEAEYETVEIPDGSIVFLRHRTDP